MVVREKRYINRACGEVLSESYKEIKWYRESYTLGVKRKSGGVKKYINNLYLYTLVNKFK